MVILSGQIISTGGEGGMISIIIKNLANMLVFKRSWKNYHSVYHKKHKLGFKWLHDNYGSNHRMTGFKQ